MSHSVTDNRKVDVSYMGGMQISFGGGEKAKIHGYAERCYTQKGIVHCQKGILEPKEPESIESKKLQMPAFSEDVRGKFNFLLNGKK